MDENLHDDLSSLVPSPPPTRDWGPKLRSRRRARRAGAAAVVAALVVACAVWVNAAVVPTAPSVASPAPTSSTTSPVRTDDDYTGVEAKGCADLRAGRLTPSEVKGDLPKGATRAWLCGPQAPLPLTGELGPREPLVDGVDRIGEAYNALPAGDGGEIACTDMGGLTYTVILEYADGPVALAGETVNCMFVGPKPHGGREFLATLRGFWDEARAGSHEFGGEMELCANRSLESFENYAIGYDSFLDVARQDAVRGVVCSVAADAPDLNAPTVSVPIPADLVAALATGEIEPFEPGVSFGQSIQPAYVVLVNRYGDPVTFGLADDGAVLVREGDQLNWWRPSDPDAWADLLAAVRIKPFYAVPDVCGGYDPATLTGDPARAVSGVACAPRDAMPGKGPELDPQLAKEIGERFAAGADKEWGQMNSANFLVLTDSTGASMRLHWDGTLPGRLVSEPGDLAWDLPEDIRVQLEAYGLNFEPE